MPSSLISVFNFQQFIQQEAIRQGYPFFPVVVNVAYDEAFYLARNPDVAQAIQDGLFASGLNHFASFGVFEGRASSAFYDEELYLLANPDIQAAVVAGTLVNGLQHFFFFGAVEGRDGLAMNYTLGGIRLSSLYDEDYYLTRNPDIAAAVGNGFLSYGFKHFVQFGLLEKGRNPSYLYNEALYLKLNPDVADAVAAGQLQNGLVHYLQFGHRENRTASVLFDSISYLAQNPDVAVAVNSGAIASAFQHFLEFGSREGRFASLFYEEAFYLAQHPDVANAVNLGVFQSGYQHFLQHGIFEARQPSKFYAEDEYLAVNPDVKAAVDSGALASGLYHYLEFGRAENRKLSNTLNYADSAQPVLVNLAQNKLVNLGNSFRIMPLGDSITLGLDGVTADDDLQGYRLELWQAFQAFNLNVDFVGSLRNGSSELEDRDHDGWSGKRFAFFQEAPQPGEIDNIESSTGRDFTEDRPMIDQLLEVNQPDLILLMLGTNENRGGSTIAGFLSTLLDTILANPTFTGTVLVGTVAPVHPDSEFISRSSNLQTYNSLIPGVVASKNTDRVRAVEVGSELDDEDDMAGVIVDNGLHPNAQGYSKMADAWYDPALDVIFDQGETIGDATNVTGSAYADTLIGDSSNNVLTGLLGNDVLTGGGGADEYIYSTPNQGLDVITDFSGDDLIKISAQGFAGGLVAGFNLGQSEAQGKFVKNGNPTNGQATFLYSTSTGILSFDRDGQGDQAAIELLKLGNLFIDLNANQIVFT
jgi:lysophospholipase L1-like esterase